MLLVFVGIVGAFVSNAAPEPIPEPGNVVVNEGNNGEINVINHSGSVRSCVFHQKDECLDSLWRYTGIIQLLWHPSWASMIKF